jgi:hypothetical protein
MDQSEPRPADEYGPWIEDSGLVGRYVTRYMPCYLGGGWLPMLVWEDKPVGAGFRVPELTSRGRSGA